MLSVNAQTTHDLNWGAASGTNLDLTIKVGDIVRWTWNDNFTHSVENSGGSTETFASDLLTGSGLTFSHQFIEVGINPYICGIHTFTMGGTITVNSLLGMEDVSLKSFSIYPNPSSLLLNIKLPNAISNAKVEVFNVLGKQVYNNGISKLNANIDISIWNSGIYFVKVSVGNSQQTKRFIKQ